MTRFVLTSLAITATAAVACTGGGSAPPWDDNRNDDGDAYLSIEGDKSVFLDAGDARTLTVKYHDQGGEPLAGEVVFRIQGSARGSSLSRQTAPTDGHGIARVNLVAGTREAGFTVLAEALDAASVDWRVSIQDGENEERLAADGSYKLESEFDIVGGLPGTMGTAINAFADLTDDANDPAKWLIDEILDELDSGVIRTLVDGVRPLLDAHLNDLLHENAPGLVNKLIKIGDDAAEVARKFGVKSNLRISKGTGADGQELWAAHSLKGITYELDGARYEYSSSELRLAEATVDGIQIELANETRLLIAEHTLPFAYGKVVLFALNRVIIPNVDSFSHSVEELLTRNIECAGVGQRIAEYVGYGSANLYESACDAALVGFAALFENRIRAVDKAASALVIQGEARPLDLNEDDAVDKLGGGLWEGYLQLGPSKATLARPHQKFVGERMPNR